MNLTAVQKAYDQLRGKGVRATLVGTAALQLRGYAVEAPDVDFLCEHEVDDEFRANSKEGEGFKLDGETIHFIGHLDDGRMFYFHPERADDIVGVSVAALEDILGLKRWANRPKDRKFFERWDAGKVGRR